MRRMTVAMAAALCFVGGLSAQEKPNFSGMWTVTTPDDPTGFCWRQCTITQDATSLMVTRNGQKAIFKLDGSESKVAGQGPQGQGGTVTRAMWDGSKLRISIEAIDVASTRSVVLSMNAGQMEVETSITRAGNNGEVPRLKHTYKKS